MSNLLTSRLIVIDYLILPEFGKTAILWEVVENALERKPAQEAKRIFLRAGILACCISISGRTSLEVPDGRSDINPEDIEIIVENTVTKAR